MKPWQYGFIGFCVFLLGGGVLYVYGCMGNKVLGVDAYFANTTVWFWITLSLWVFGLWLLRESLSYAKKPRGLLFVFASAFCFFFGYLLVESLLYH